MRARSLLAALGLVPLLALALPPAVEADRGALVDQMRFADVAPPIAPVATQVSPSQPTDWMVVGDAARARKDLEQAIDAYRRAGDGPDALFWLGTVQRWVGDLEGAAATFARLLAAHPDHTDGLLGDARVALRTGDPARAERDLTHRMDVAPDAADAPEAGRLLVTAYLTQGKRRDAYNFVDRAYTGDDRVRAQADIAFQLRWYRRAARAYRDLLARHPDDVGLVLALGRTDERMGYLNDAADLYGDALRAHPDDAELQVRAAAVHRWLGAYPSAVAHADTVLEADPDRPDALLERAYEELSRDHLDDPGRTTVTRIEVPPVSMPSPHPPPLPVAEPEPAAAPVADQVTAPVAPTTEEVAQPIPTTPVAPPRPLRVSHTVKPGDTLSGLAETFLGDLHRWPEIRDANPQIPDPDRIYPGQQVLILVHPAGVRLVPHRVRPGDSLSRIALAYLGDLQLWRAVWQANPGIADPNVIEPGQVVRVPVAGPDLPPGMGLEPYTVRRGETLGGIARRELGAAGLWTVVWRVNPELKDPNRIRTGQVINVPRTLPGPPAPPPPVVAAPAVPVPPPAAPPAPPVVAVPAPRLVVHREGWGATQWVRQALNGQPTSREGRRLLGRIEMRKMDFAAAHDRFRALRTEAPGDCELCAELRAARAERLPVLDASYRYDTARDLDGRADQTLASPATPVRYRTRAWEVGARHRVARRLALQVRYGRTDTSLTNLVTDVPIYDFDARTGWFLATGYIADRHTVTAGVGTSDYSPNDGSSIADRRFTRLRLAWDGARWNGAWHLAGEQGPYLGRSIPPQQAYSLFRERRFSASGERDVTPRTRVYARYAHAGYDDGTATDDGAVGARFRLGTHRIEAELAQGHQPGRFLDEAGGNLELVFVRTREARLTDRWSAPFPMRFAAGATFRSFDRNTMVVGGTTHSSPSNQEVDASAEAAYAHPALAPLSFGVGYDYVQFDKDAFAYDTVDSRGPDLFLELADADGDCWSYRLRYTWGMRWDEDPMNDHFTRNVLEGSARIGAGTHLSAGLGGRYGRASAIEQESVRLTADLTWRF